MVSIQGGLQFWGCLLYKDAHSPKDGDYQREGNSHWEDDCPRDGDHLGDGGFFGRVLVLRTVNVLMMVRMPFGSIVFKKLYLMFIPRICDKQTNITVFRVAPRLKMSK